MNKELELWQFISGRLESSRPVMLLVVAESSGSSPGRQGYKMAVGSDGELVGSIGGGVMEVSLVEQGRAILSERPQAATGVVKEQIHRKNVPNSSGMICSGEQTVIMTALSLNDLPSVEAIISGLTQKERPWLWITEKGLGSAPENAEPQNRPLPYFEVVEDVFYYLDKLGPSNELYIVGGGHCALALCELMSKMDFHIRLFDDRPNLNTIEKNDFAHKIKIIESYELIADSVPSGENHYVVVMTLGYKSDEAVIKKLLDKEFKYFGVLGSKAKMATLIKSLREHGCSKEKLDRIHTPIGLPINSRTPEEIAVSIAAEIIAVKNSAIE